MAARRGEQELGRLTLRVLPFRRPTRDTAERTSPIEITMTSTPDHCMACGSIDARTTLGAILCQDCEEQSESVRRGGVAVFTQVTARDE
ncbi:MAG: hypothetical protein AUI15_22080 [Actinobacteria bacterium 13_2_20CM_2_66_6]|nr:MAG: hypothetical protein AUI15_22080 [Actinobacteria bacterium 13_2_20CM_2_66_6]